MLISSKWMAAPLLAVSSFMFTADAPTASAGHGIFGGGGLRISFGRSYRPSYRSYAPIFRSHYGHSSNYGHGSYHDTSHYDYHPTEIRRHGNHWHVQPGHYDFHRTGHWHH